MKSFLFLTFFFGFSFANLDAQSLNCSVQAQSAILYNPENGAILFQKQMNAPHYPASTLKVAVALFILDRKKPDLDTEVVVSKEMIEIMDAKIKQADPLAYPSHILENDGIMVGLKEGEVLSLNALLHGMLIASGNDAANALAQACSGSIEEFMCELNAYLKEKGIEQTRLHNPHGLHYPAQMTTAYDMAKIAALAFSNPTFSKVIQTSVYEGERTILNINTLSKTGKYQYSKSLGGKNGYIGLAGYNLVAAAEDQGRRLIAVILGCETKEDRFKDAVTLFETAFLERPQKRLLFSKEHERFSCDVARSKSLLQAYLAEDVEIIFFPSEEGEWKAQVIWKQFQLPIEKGEEVGQLIVSDDRGNQITSSPLFALEPLEKKAFYEGVESVRWGFVLLFFVFIFGYAYQLFKQSSKFKER